MTDYSDYYRLTIYAQKSDKKTIEERAAALGLSVSAYVYQLIEQDIARITGDSLAGKKEYGTPGQGRRDRQR